MTTRSQISRVRRHLGVGCSLGLFAVAAACWFMAIDVARAQDRGDEAWTEEKEGPLLSELPEEDALEVLYQRMLRDHPQVEDMPKEQLMWRLRAMLKEELAGERSGTREGGNAQGARGNDRAVDGSDQKVPGTLKWSVQLGGAVGYHSPAVAEDGTIYMAGGRQRLIALHPDGSEKWTFVAGSGYPIAGAAIGKDGTIYIGTWSQDGSDSRIYAITADGTEKWSYPVGDKIEFSSPAIGKDGTIYIGCYDDHLYAIHGESGGLADTPWPMFGGDLRHTGRAPAEPRRR